MRRAAAVLLALAALLVSSCAPGARAGLWITHMKRTALTGCVSPDCGPYGAELHWNLAPWAHPTTGYYVFLNGVQQADVPSSPWQVSGADCGTTVTLGVEQHDNLTPVDRGPMYSTNYTTPACPITGGGSAITKDELQANMGSQFGTFHSNSPRTAFVSSCGTGKGCIFVSYMSHWTANNTQCNINFAQATTGANSSGAPNDGCTNTMTIARSTDGGQTFSPDLVVGVGHHAVPSLVTDTAGDVFAIVPNFSNVSHDGGMWVWKLPAGSWTSPVALGILAGGYSFSDKTSAGYDAAGPSAANGGTIWVTRGADFLWNGSDDGVMWRFAANWNGSTINSACSGSSENCYMDFNRLDSGSAIPAAAKTNGTGGSYTMYPEIYADRSGSCPANQTVAEPAGSGSCDFLVAAWTESTSAFPFAYYDIHYVISTDGGVTWYGKNGQIGSFPFSSGDDGPAWQLLNKSEYNATTCTNTPPTGNCVNNDENWLANVYVQDGHLFFVYRNSTQHVQYRRVTPTWNGSNGYTVNADVSASLSLTASANKGAVFSGTGAASSRIYLSAGASANENPIMLSSVHDGSSGADWTTYASPTSGSYGSLYAISGGHGVGPNGSVLIAGTDQTPDNIWFWTNP